MEDGTERPFVCASRTLSKSELNYSQIEKEALALIYGIKNLTSTYTGKGLPWSQIINPWKSLAPKPVYLQWQREYSVGRYCYRATAITSNSGNLRSMQTPTPYQGFFQQIGKKKLDVYRVHFVEKLPLTAQAVSQATKTDPILARVYKLRVWLAWGMP